MNSNTDQKHAIVDEASGEQIGGWLFLVAIGIIFAPISNGIHLKELIGLAQNANWDVIWQQGPIAMLSILFEFAIQGYMFIFSIILAVLFLYRRVAFPKMFIIYIVSIFVLGVIGAVITFYVPNITAELVGEAIAFPIYIFLLGLVWIPYFLKSKRVKKTFVLKGSLFRPT